MGRVHGFAVKRDQLGWAVGQAKGIRILKQRGPRRLDDAIAPVLVVHADEAIPRPPPGQSIDDGDQPPFRFPDQDGVRSGLDVTLRLQGARTADEHFDGGAGFELADQPADLGACEGVAVDAHNVLETQGRTTEVALTGGETIVADLDMRVKEQRTWRVATPRPLSGRRSGHLGGVKDRTFINQQDKIRISEFGKTSKKRQK